MGLSNEEKSQRSKQTANIQTFGTEQKNRYVFISYKSDDWRTVLDEIVRELVNRYGLRVYFDKKFDDDNSSWVENMKAAIDTSRCQAVIAFVSKNYMGSYACAMELMKARGNTTFLHHKKRVLDIIPIIVDESRSVEEAGEDLYEPLSIAEWSDYSALMEDVLEYAQNAVEIDAEKQLMQKDLGQAMDALIKKGSRATEEDLSLAICTILSRAHERKYDPNNTEFFEHLYNTLKRISPDIFDDALIGSCGSVRPSAASQPLSSPEAPAVPKRRGRPPKSTQPAETAEPPRAEVSTISEQPQKRRVRPASAPEEMPELALKRDCTIGSVRAAFSDPETVRRFKPVRENMPWGGKGAMDYAMASVLGGCNAVKADSPVYQINYYLYAVASGGEKDGSLGATWTWSSNCRKVLGLEKSGQIPDTYNDCFRWMNESVTLQQIGERFASAEEEAFQTIKNGLVITGLNRLSEFLADEL